MIWEDTPKVLMILKMMYFHKSLKHNYFTFKEVYFTFKEVYFTLFYLFYHIKGPLDMALHIS